MKKFLGFLTLALILSCGTAKIVKTDPDNIPSGPDGLKGSIVTPDVETISKSETSVTQLEGNRSDFSDAEKTGAIIKFLASDELKGREAGSEGIAMAANFIEDIFKANEIAPYFSSYKDTLSNFEKPAYNIVGVLEGNDPVLKNEFVIIGAHYDHIGQIAAVNGDAIANGANDNASGTTTVLELARYFGTNKSNKRSIIFSLFSPEEKGLLGSKHLAKKLKDQNIDLYAMLNFEMVGVALQDKDYFMYLTGYKMSNMADVANKYANENLIGYLPSAAQMNLFQRSDNHPFHEQFNVPSQTFCTFDFTNFDHYHQVGDEAELMDFGHMAEVVNRAIPAVEGIVNAPTKEIKYN